MTARRLPNGLLRPELADLMEGARVAQDLGLDPSTIPHRALVAMGRAVTDRDMADYHGPVYPNEGKDLVLTPEASATLDRIVAERAQPVHQAMDQAPDQGVSLDHGTEHPTPTSQDLRPSVTGNRYAQDPAACSGSEQSLGQVDHVADQAPATPVQNANLDRKGI